MLELMVLAIALSMDAFAVAIGLGAKQRQATQVLATKAGLYFGGFQAGMTALGYLGGKGLLVLIASIAHWLAFILLALVGAKMIYEALSEGEVDQARALTHRMLLVLAVATSIDAMAAGFSLTLLNVNAWLACAVIGVATFIFSGFGVFIGTIGGERLGSKAEMLGGISLILLGLKMLF